MKRQGAWRLWTAAIGSALATVASAQNITLSPDRPERPNDVSLIRTDKPGVPSVVPFGTNSVGWFDSTNGLSCRLPAMSGEALFNGKDFSGWTFYMRTNADPMQTWSISNGVIQCTGRPNGYMRTKERFYGGYRLKVEWRFVRPGNTGVLVHMQDPDKVWPMTIECQGAHGQQGDFWMQGGAQCKDHETAQTRRVLKREESNEKALGEWNTYEVECAGRTVRIYVNGKLMNEALECNLEAGYIGLQSEGAAYEVRKIEIEPTEQFRKFIEKAGGSNTK